MIYFLQMYTVCVVLVPLHLGFFYNEHVTIGSTLNMPLTQENIESLLEHEATNTFLSGFKSEVHMNMVLDYLQHCPYNDLCGFSFNLSYPKNSFGPCCTTCRCDFPTCLSNRSCCVDIIPERYIAVFDPAISSDTDDELGELMNGKEYTPKDAVELLYELEPIGPQCRLMHAKEQTNFRQKSRLVIATCPKSTQNNLKTKCEQVYNFENIQSVDDMVPVTDLATERFYRNKYCAQCNLATPFVNKWKVILALSESKTTYDPVTEIFLEKVFKGNVYDLRFEPEGYEPPPLCENLVTECNRTGLWDTYEPISEAKCALFSSGFNGHNIGKYQNFFCMQCNGFEMRTHSCDAESSHPSEPYAFSGLVAMQALSETSADSSRSPAVSKCKASNQIYDPVLDTCKSMTCSQYHFLKNFTCLPLFYNVERGFYSLRIRLTTESTIYLEFMHSILPYLQETLENYLKLTENIEELETCRSQIFFTLFERLEPSDEVDAAKLASQKVRNIDFLYYFKVGYLHSPYEITTILKRVNRQTFLMSYFTIKIWFWIEILGDASPKFPFSIEQGVIPFTELPSHALLDELKRTILPYPNRIFQAPCVSDTNYVNVLRLRECPTVAVERMIRPWNETEYGVYFPDTGFTLNYSYFYFENEVVMQVCSSDFINILKTEEVYFPKVQIKQSSTFYNINVQQALSIACISISLFGLIVTIVVFLSIPPLRTLPGLNTVTLSASLLVAQCLYIVSSFARLGVKSVECVSVGIALHFFSLLAVFWMNICTFHMFRVLTVIKVRSNSFQKKYALFHLYAFFCSLIPVGICIVLSHHISDGNNIGYGLVTCYISSKNMLRYTFVFPLFAVVLSNFIMFIFVVVKIDRGPKNIRANAKQERNDFIIFIKLSTLTGMTWIFGVLYSWLEITALSYIFVVFNASQGTFIMISFVLNARVWNLCKETVSETLSRTFSTKSDLSSTKRSTSGSEKRLSGRDKYKIYEEETNVRDSTENTKAPKSFTSIKVEEEKDGSLCTESIVDKIRLEEPETRNSELLTNLDRDIDVYTGNDDHKENMPDEIEKESDLEKANKNDKKIVLDDDNDTEE